MNKNNFMKNLNKSNIARDFTILGIGFFYVMLFFPINLIWDNEINKKKLFAKQTINFQIFTM